MRVIPILLLSAAALAQPNLDARKELNLGVMEFKQARYDDAVAHFKEAVRLDPGFLNAHLYLGVAYMQMYIPGSEAAANVDNARQAIAEFQEVLKLEPENEVAIAYTANLYFNQKKFDQSAEWYKKLIEVKPDNKEAYYTEGVIIWSQWYPEYKKARERLGLKPEDPGPFTDETVRQELKTKWSAKIDLGLQYLEKALGLDPAYHDAMAYMNLLIRERADLAGTKEDYQRDTNTADDWVQKALETKKRKAAAVRQ